MYARQVPPAGRNLGNVSCCGAPPAQNRPAPAGGTYQSFSTAVHALLGGLVELFALFRSSVEVIFSTGSPRTSQWHPSLLDATVAASVRKRSVGAKLHVQLDRALLEAKAAPSSFNLAVDEHPEVGTLPGVELGIPA